MERLTQNAIDCMTNFCEAEDCVNYEANGCCSFEKYRKLAYYEDLEEQGRLAILPCKIGDTVYQPSYKFTKCTAHDYAPRYAHDSDCEGCESKCDSVCNPYIHVGKVCEMRVLPTGITVRIHFTEKFDTSYYTVGKSVFLFKEEAEAALRGENNDD